MKKLLPFIILISGIAGFRTGHSQGWIAEIRLNLNHDLYALENISSATLSYSGKTVSGSSSTRHLSFVIQGNGSITGNITLAIKGLAYEPYDGSNPYNEPMSATFSGNYATHCDTGFFEKEGANPQQHIYIWINFYPRLEISSYTNECNVLNFATEICSPFYTWEMSDNLYGNFKTIPGKTSRSITLTADDLKKMGFADPFARKYFRVTGKTGTTSLLEPVDIPAASPTASFTTTSPKCYGAADGQIRVDITSSNPSQINDFLLTLDDGNSKRQGILNDRFTFTFTGLPAGKYTIEIENNSDKAKYGNCSATYKLISLINPPKVIISGFEVSDFNGYPIKCKGGNEGTIKAITSGGTGSYPTFEWTPNVSTTGFAKNLSEGSYRVRVKDANGCWSDQYARTLTAPEKLSVTLISSGGKNGFDVSCHDKRDGKIETKITGGIPSYSWLWSNGSTTSAFNNAPPGTYGVSITDKNGCVATASIQLVSPQPIDFALQQIQEIKCPGDHSGILEVQFPVNTIGRTYYSWSSGESGNLITNKPAGDYAVTVSDDQGCKTTKYHSLIEARPFSVEIVPSSDFNGSFIRCNGENSGVLTTLVRNEASDIVSADYYTWYKDGNKIESGINLSTLGDLGAGTYKAEITYKGFCRTENTYVLNAPPPLVADISIVSNYNGSPISCDGASDGSIRVTATGGTGNNYSFSWKSGQSEPILSGIPSGIYVVNARDVNGCESTVEKIVEDPEPVEAVISLLSNFNGQAISCADASDARLRGSATGGSASFSYVWNTGHTTQDLIDMPAGHYTLTATDKNGCTVTANTIVVNPLPVKALITDMSDYNGFGVSCHGSDDGFLLAEASGGTGVYEFAWGGSSFSSPRYRNLSSGTYTVTASDQNGCSDRVEAVLSEPDLLTLEALQIKNVSCKDGDDGEIKLVSKGGVPPYEFSSSGISWQDESLLHGLQAGLYQAMVRDVNGCVETLMQTLKEPEAISIQFEDIQPALCGDARGKVSAVVSGGTGGYRYEWTDTEAHLVGTERTVSGLMSGIITLAIIDDHSCEAAQSVGISATDGPKALISNIVPASCSYTSDGSASLEVTDGEGPFSFLWQDGQDAAQAINLIKGSHLVEITDSNNCITVESITVPGPDSLHLEVIEKIEPKCHGECNGKIRLAASGGNGNYIYDWKDFIGSEKNNLCAGEYDVTVMDAQGCADERTIILSQPDPLNVELTRADPPACQDGCDGKLEIQGSGGTGSYRYEWSTGQTDPMVNGLCAGNYSVSIIDLHGCSISETYGLTDPDGYPLDLGGSVTLCEGQSHVLDPGSWWESYSWSSNTGFNSTDQRVTISKAGLYWLDVVSSKGCVVQDTFFLNTSRELLDANFLMTSEAVAGDTVVMIDISWPLPENITWTFPDEMNRMSDQGDIVYGKFENPGQYDVSLTATLGECSDEITKTIIVLYDEDNMTDAGRLGHETFLKEFNLFPNPNDGMFEVEVQFLEESPVVLTVWNTLTSMKIGQYEDSGRKQYLTHVDLRPLSAGNYTLRLDFSKGTKYLRFIVR